MQSKLGVSVSALLIMGALVFRQQVLEAFHSLSASLTNLTDVSGMKRRYGSR